MDHTFKEFPVFARACCYLANKFYNPHFLLSEKYKIGWNVMMEMKILAFISKHEIKFNEDFLSYAEMEKIIKPEDLTPGYLESVVVDSGMCFDDVMKEYYETIFKLAINKLKRNKIVKEGILLKLSMKYLDIDRKFYRICRQTKKKLF